MMLAPSVNFDYVARAPLAGGLTGVRQTIGTMRRLVDQAKTDPAIRQTAVDVIYLTPPKDEGAEVEALFGFVQEHIRYTRDVLGVETLMSPLKILEAQVGDCDDKSALLAALLESVGYPTRFVVAGYHEPGVFEHVYIQAQMRAGWWVDLDATEPGPMGNAPPAPVALWLERV